MGRVWSFLDDIFTAEVAEEMCKKKAWLWKQENLKGEERVIYNLAR